MAAGKKTIQINNPTIAIICGEDDFQVKQRAQMVFEEWKSAFPDADYETIDGLVTNVSEALAAIGRTQEALETLPFFGSTKLVWLKACSFLGDDRTASSQAVSERLKSLAETLERLDSGKSRFLLSAGKIDKRKVFYKAVSKLGSVEIFDGWSLSDKNWPYEAEKFLTRFFKEHGNAVGQNTLGEMAHAVGPNLRSLSVEAEKVSLYAGEGNEVRLHHVRDVVVYQKQARAFALSEALGERDAVAVLGRLDEELWSMKTDRTKSVIGLLYGLIGKVRSLLLVRGLIDAGWIRQARDYNAFKTQLARVPADRMPEDKRFNPLSGNPFMVFKSAQHAFNFESWELVSAMRALLECNLKLVSTTVDETQLIRQTLMSIVTREIQQG